MFKKEDLNFVDEDPYLNVENDIESKEKAQRKLFKEAIKKGEESEQEEPYDSDDAQELMSRLKRNLMRKSVNRDKNGKIIGTKNGLPVRKIVIE